MCGEHRGEHRRQPDLQRVEVLLVLAVGAAVLERQHDDGRLRALGLQRPGDGDRGQGQGPPTRRSHRGSFHRENPSPSIAASTTSFGATRRAWSRASASSAIDRGVVVLRLVVKQDQPRARRLRGQIDRLARCRVPPPGAHLDELVRVHGVVNQRVCPRQKLHQPLSPVIRYRIRATRAQLVVGHVGDLSTAVGRAQPVAERRPGVPQPERADPEVAERRRRPPRCPGPRCLAASASSGTGNTIGSIWRRRMSSERHALLRRAVHADPVAAWR